MSRLESLVEAGRGKQRNHFVTIAAINPKIFYVNCYQLVFREKLAEADET